MSKTSNPNPFRTKPRYSTHELNSTTAVSLTDGRLCPPKGEHSAEEFTINIIALRLEAYREYAELPRPHLLTLVARKTGSPASHLVSQTLDLDPQNTREACQRPTTLTLFRTKPRYSTHELNTTAAATGTAQILINSAQHMLQETIHPAQCAAINAHKQKTSALQASLIKFAVHLPSPLPPSPEKL